MTEKPTPHTHKTEHGFIIKCYHKCKNSATDPIFWIGITLAFPFEHFLWTKIPIFRDVANYLGLL